MSNFSFLKNEFSILFDDSVRSESYIYKDPTASAFYARKALESSLRLIYTIDDELNEKLLDESNSNTFNLLTNYDFQEILPPSLLNELHLIRKTGNLASHANDKNITKDEALYVNKALYRFERWIVEVYSNYEVDGEYIENQAEQELKNSDYIDISKVLDEHEKLLKELAKLKQALEQKEQTITPKREVEVVKIKDIDEKTTRAMLIDIELKEAGYKIDKFKKGKDIEYKLVLEDGSFGYADYVLWDSYDNPIAVIEAKRSSVDITKGKTQAKRYAKALEAVFKKEVLVFVTNGKVIEYESSVYPFREIHSIFSTNTIIQKLNQIENIKKNKLSKQKINDDITNRTYQKRVIKDVFDTYELYKTRALIVMATGSGKTRVATSISEIMLKCGWARKILFLADRKELVKQARITFDKYLNETSVNLVEEKKDLSARMHFGIYESVHNLIKNAKYDVGSFDLIIVDEAHRSIYKKYRALFEYFDSFILGLTATPADEIHRNTYEFFHTQNNEPTSSYSLPEAIEDGNLVDFKGYEIDLGIIKRGIKYSELSGEEKEHFEESFEDEFIDIEDEKKHIQSNEINQRIFNKQTNERVLEYLFKHGLHLEDGNKIGKTIIFTKNQHHAKYLKEIFDMNYPSKKNQAEVIHSEIAHVDSLIDNFKIPNKDPQIAISVDMLDTGVDVPEVVNLVFFKPLKSKIKFWQMVGRGTRLCKDLFGKGLDKEYFNIFDFCENLSFFDIKPDGVGSSNSKPLKQRLFLKRVDMLRKLEDKELKQSILKKVSMQIQSLDESAYNLKKYKDKVLNVKSADLSDIDDELYKDINTISEFIEDYEDNDVQRFHMFILSTQENVVDNKDNSKNIDELKAKVKRLTNSSIKNIDEIKKKKGVIKEFLDDKFEYNNITNLQMLKDELEIFSKYMDKEKYEPKKTSFDDKVEEIRAIDTSILVSKSVKKSRINEMLDEYLQNVELLKTLEENEYITNDDIVKIKHYVNDIQKNIDEKLDESEGLEKIMKDIVNASSKELANTILDNFLEKNSYSIKQTKLINKIKNLIYDKQFLDIPSATIKLHNFLGDDNHPINKMYDDMKDIEQEGIIKVIEFIEKLDFKENKIKSNSYAQEKEELLVASPTTQYGK